MELLSTLTTLVEYGVIAASVLLVIISIVLRIITEPYPVVDRHKDEESYEDPETNTKEKFPSIKDAPSVSLSVVVPAYNEQDRLPPMLDEALEFLEKKHKTCPTYKYEFIVVSDGSTDKTVDVVRSYTKKYGSEKGIQSSRGALILFADADGASKFEDLIKLESCLEETVHCDSITQPEKISDTLAVVIGSRAHLEDESLASRSIFRNILMYGFHFLVWLFTVRGIKDTQCGFKLFTRKAAGICFQNLHVNRWAFDVELLYIAQKLNIPIKEIPVRWTEIEGSKVTPVVSWIQMGCDLGLIWLKYMIGAWKIRGEKLE